MPTPFAEKEFISTYNEGMYQIQRLHFLWIDCNNKSRTGDLQGWRWTLDTIWRELTRDAVKDRTPDIKSVEELKDKNSWFVQYHELDKKINDAGTDKRKKYDALSQLEIFLRILQNEVGKGGKYRDPDEDGMEG